MIIFLVDNSQVLRSDISLNIGGAHLSLAVIHFKRKIVVTLKRLLCRALISDLVSSLIEKTKLFVSGRLSVVLEALSSDRGILTTLGESKLHEGSELIVSHSGSSDLIGALLDLVNLGLSSLVQRMKLELMSLLVETFIDNSEDHVDQVKDHDSHDNLGNDPAVVVLGADFRDEVSGEDHEVSENKSSNLIEDLNKVLKWLVLGSNSGQVDEVEQLLHNKGQSKPVSEVLSVNSNKNEDHSS